MSYFILLNMVAIWKGIDSILGTFAASSTDTDQVLRLKNPTTYHVLQSQKRQQKLLTSNTASPPPVQPGMPRTAAALPSAVAASGSDQNACGEVSCATNSNASGKFSGLP